jgi:peptidyl-tRNA hydrolase
LRSHVLGRFDAAERPQIDAAVQRAADAAEVFVRENILAAMNQYNAAPAAAEED